MTYFHEFIISILTVGAFYFAWYKMELSLYKPLKAMIIPILIVTIIDAIGSIFFFKYSTFVTQSLFILFTAFYFKKSIKKAIVEFCSVLITFYILLIPFGVLLNYLASIEYAYFKLINALYVFVAVFILSSFVPLNSFYKKYEDLLTKSIYLLLSIALVSYIFILSSVEVLDTYLWMSVVFLAFVFAMFAFIQSILDTKEQTSMMKAYEQHSHTILPLLDEIRSKQHDFKNHLAAIYGLCQQNPTDTLPIKNYIHTLNHSFQDSNILLSMKNKVIGAIISSKTYEAEAKNIDFACNIPPYDVNFPLLNYEYASLLGNLLDNAFEAPMISAESHKKVYLKIDTLNSLSYIEVGNNGIPIDQQTLSKVFKRGFTTKQDKKGHGYGLYSVKKLLSKYRGNIEVSMQGDYTVFKAVIPSK